MGRRGADQSRSVGAGRDRWLSGRSVRAGSFYALAVAASLLGVVVLFVLLISVLVDGGGSLFRDLPGFISGAPSRFAGQAGIKVALLGTLWMMAFTALFSFPIGLGAAIYLEEYAPRHWLTRLIQINITNLAGVPSIVYGILGLAVFVRALDRSVLSAALTMSLLIMPIIIITAQEALRGRPLIPAPGIVFHGCDPVADDLAYRASPGCPRHPDGDHPGPLPRHRRDGSPHYGWGPHLYFIYPRQPSGPIRRIADSDLQLDQQAPRGVP